MHAPRCPLSARLLVLSLLALCLPGCGKPEKPAGTAAGAAPPDALEILFTYGSEKKAWIEAVTPGFNQSGVRTAAGRPVFVTAIPMGSGDCVDEVLKGTRQAHLISPASAVFLQVGNAQSQAATGKPLASAPVNLVLSPVVIAMWQPMAEKLGWPAKPLGWADVHAMAADPRGWASRGAPQWGQFRFGHTHPDYSNSGLLAVIAEVAAATGKVRGLTLEDVQLPATAAYVRQIEQAVVHYGDSTGFFGQKMFDGGPEYLSAAVLYENMVIESRSRTGKDELVAPVVAIYPKEGTFWSDHPAAVVNREWVTPEHAEAAKQYLDYLTAVPQQETALASGFRPGNVSVALDAPVDTAHGVDPAQPQTLLDVPAAPVVDAIRRLWAQNKKSAAVTLVFDCSGSMKDDNKMTSARAGAKKFIELLGDGDTLSILAFNNQLAWLAQDQPVGPNRARLQQIASGLLPNGGTHLYDAVAEAAQRTKAKADPARISAMVVLSDGEDQGSGRSLAAVLSSITAGGEEKGVRIFSIAYGSGAKFDVLQQLADAARGKASRGNSGDIERLFREISVYF